MAQDLIERVARAIKKEHHRKHGDDCTIRLARAAIREVLLAYLEWKEKNPHDNAMDFAGVHNIPLTQEKGGE